MITKLGMGLAALVIVAGGLYWFADIVRKADRADAANQTIEELKKRDKDDSDFKKLDMAGICRELDLDVLPDGSGCQ